MAGKEQAERPTFKGAEVLKTFYRGIRKGARARGYEDLEALASARIDEINEDLRKTQLSMG